ncbi:lysozyme C-1-like isoform X3 [Scyliorhinus canicula]|uniref:lysozyme C-1-like isoform X3 n=1 Tax=Scyliorhinus canicula TaxID=7830 RepID=UPI0018F49B00|nr:lysozyme C-1-like isoform X3 [Scyliorhinus canicula]
MAKGITASRAVIRKMRTFLILSALLTGVRPYVYQKCELAELLHKNGLDGYRGYNLANWVCLVQHESNYDTRVIGRNRRGGKNLSSDYGIFQINSIRWCEDGRTQNTRKLKNGCKKSCRDFINDNITDDIQCVKRIVRPQGMNAWYGWKKRCQKRNLNDFLDDCKM